jgi:hypothetical protein
MRFWWCGSCLTKFTICSNRGSRTDGGTCSRRDGRDAAYRPAKRSPAGSLCRCHRPGISRNTAFTYKDKRVDTKQIGRGLGVRYVLEGSVRRSSSQVRVNAQLIDAETDAHLWAERFDGDAGDLFAMQNTITGRIARAVDAEVITAEARRPAEHPDALDYILRGRSAYNHWPYAITMHNPSACSSRH